MTLERTQRTPLDGPIYPLEGSQFSPNRIDHSASLFSRFSPEAATTGKKSAKTTKLMDGHQVGKASWYGPGFHGKKTASGQIFNQHALTAAHPRLRLGSRAKVTNLHNGKQVEVTINDRGPHKGGRIIDLSRGAAKKLAMDGIARVSIVALSD